MDNYTQRQKIVAAVVLVGVLLVIGFSFQVSIGRRG